MRHGQRKGSLTQIKADLHRYDNIANLGNVKDT